jgi:hypothetical protein
MAAAKGRDKFSIMIKAVAIFRQIGTACANAVPFAAMGCIGQLNLRRVRAMIRALP